MDALLDKGYKPEHIILEPTFFTGRQSDKIYGDILVLDQNFENLVLIENKTPSEFKKEWQNMLKTGGQLFNYYALNKVPYLCLLTYEFDENEKKPFHTSHIIYMKDNDEYITRINADLNKDKQKKRFDSPENANAKDYFSVWNDTYSQSYTSKGLLETDILAYQVGKEKYNLENDLQVVSHSQIASIYHDFATILRNNAIGNYENAFYILVDLFLCKITDELENPQDLQFYYKGVAYDNPFDYLDRLLNLYEKGVKKLFDKEVVNIHKNAIEELFKSEKRVRGNLKLNLEKLFDKQRYFNIKKFNFLEVENEEEFYINFKVLVKIANLIQDFKISQSENNQFLGDLFEGFLNRSVHQTEGRFFTPTPITNFIIKSLPPSFANAKILDFACGAGHFLTEFIAHYKDAKLYGIEKNKDLSKVAKTACIFHSSDIFRRKDEDAQIIFQDALDSIQDSFKDKFEDGSFDLIISNPPYSVKGFLSTLPNKRIDKFTLSQDIDKKSYDKNNAIECFFIERASQFLKDGGIFALILPISILQKGGLYQKTRELLFLNFEILSIIELNSRTFGSTGTQTCIIFAKKIPKSQNDLINALKERNFDPEFESEEFTSISKDFTNANILPEYCAFMGYDFESFLAFMREFSLNDEIKRAFKDYFDDFNANKPKFFKKEKLKASKIKELFINSSFYKDDLKENSKAYKEQMANFEKSAEFKELERKEHYEAFLRDIKELECEKLLYFALLQDNEILVIKSPSDKTSDKKTNKANIIKFLGYDWSKRKGDEGIKYQSKRKEDKEDESLKENSDDSDDEKHEEVLKNINSVKFIDTQLYNPSDINDENKLNTALKAFIEKKNYKDLIEKLNENAQKDTYTIFTTRLIDTINSFKNVEFNKAISLNLHEKEMQDPFLDTKFELVKISNICEIGRGRVISHKEIEANKGDYPVYSSQTTNDGIMGYINTYDFEGEYVTWTTDGVYAGTCFYRNGKFNCTNVCGTLKIKNTKEMLYYFLKEVLNLATPSYVVKSANPKLMNNVMENIKIPKPPLEIQKQIILECENIENEEKIIKDLINAYESLIKAILAQCKICDFTDTKPQTLINTINSLESNLSSINSNAKPSTQELDPNALLKSLPKIPQNGWDKISLNSPKIDLQIGKRVLDNELRQNGKIPVYSANVRNPFGYIDKEILQNYDKDSVIWGIDGDWMVNFIPKNTPFYPTDHCGVLQVRQGEIKAKILQFSLENEGTKIGFSRDLRASISRIKDLKLPLPPLKAQESIIQAIEKLESKITTLNSKIPPTKRKNANHKIPFANSLKMADKFFNFHPKSANFLKNIFK